MTGSAPYIATAPTNGSVLAQSSMSPRFIVIGDKFAKDPAQMGLTEHNQMVETFASEPHPAPTLSPWRRQEQPQQLSMFSSIFSS
jgi:hypothetical protein